MRFHPGVLAVSGVEVFEAGLQLWLASHDRAQMNVEEDGTGAAIVYDGDVVGRLIDLSPNAYQAIQATSANRPIYSSSVLRGGTLRADATARQLYSIGAVTDFNFIHKTGIFTIAGFFRLEATGTQVLLDTAGDSLSNHGFTVTRNSSARLQIRGMNGSGTQIWSVAVSGTILSASTWYFFCCRGDGATVTAQVTTLSSDTTTTSTGAIGTLSTSDATNTLSFLAYGGAGVNTSPYKGAMDDVIIYSRYLSDAKVTTLKNYNSIPTTTPVRVPHSYSHVFFGNDVDADRTLNSAYSTNGAITTWKQNKTTFDPATQSTAALKPWIVKGERDMIAYGPSDFLTVTDSTADLSYLHNTAVFDIVMVVRHDNNGAFTSPAGETNNSSAVFGSGTDASESGMKCIFIADNGILIRIGGNSENHFVLATSAATWTLANGRYGIIRISCNGTTMTTSLNNGTATSTAKSGTLTAGDASATYRIGGVNSGVDATVGFDGAIAFIGFWPRQFATGEWTEFYTHLADYYSTLLSATPTRVACLGDSLTANFTGAEFDYPSIVERSLGSAYTVGNYGFHSNTLSQMHTRYTSNIDSKGVEWIVLLGGINDIRAGTSAATTFSTWSTLVDELLNDGLKVAAVTLLPCGNDGSLSSAEETERVACNALLASYTPPGGTASNFHLIDAESTFAGGAGLTGVALKAEYDHGDGIHLSAAGNQAMATLVTPVIQAG